LRVLEVVGVAEGAVDLVEEDVAAEFVAVECFAVECVAVEAGFAVECVVVVAGFVEECTSFDEVDFLPAGHLLLDPRLDR
jgi:hypothetical protein